jgi:hypothetical protein
MKWKEVCCFSIAAQRRALVAQCEDVVVQLEERAALFTVPKDFFTCNFGHGALAINNENLTSV